MRLATFSICVLFIIFSSLFSSAQGAPPEEFDVVVYGGTSGGVAAAVQTARSGKSVVLIEPGKHLGGLSSGGLGATDTGNRSVIGGISREFYHRLWLHYSDDANWTSQTRQQFIDNNRRHPIDVDTIWVFEPHVAEQVFNDMIEEAKVTVVLEERIDLESGVEIKEGQIQSITMESGRTFAGRVFIDTTYEGDLMAVAGISYTVGREAMAQYNETLNGVQAGNAASHQFALPVDPYITPGEPDSGLLPGIHNDGRGEEGTADHRVQGYCFRMCTTDVPENRRDWEKPEEYDPARYELLLRYFEAGSRHAPWHPSKMPNRKTDTNNSGAVSTDNIGMNYDYPDGDYETRDRIIAEHLTYQKGLMWTLANSPRVPESVREHFQLLGLAKDEFIETDNWPHQLYIREARRMIGEAVITERHLRRLEPVTKSIGMGSYNMDSHNVQRYVDDEGYARNEGDVQIYPGGPYEIGYDSICPKQEECTNLLVPTCLSCSHIAYGSIRMEPVFMILGQSAATAACQSIDADIDVQAVSYDLLRDELLEAEQILQAPEGTRFAVPPLLPSELEGVVLDSEANDKAVRMEGEWTLGRSISPFVGAHYYHDGNEKKGEMSIRFEITPPKAGRYDVRLSYTASSNRATNVPVILTHAEGTATVIVNQREEPTIKKAFISLGIFPLSAERPTVIVISNEGTDGYVIVDTIQILAVEE